jgi:RNA polymerase sigma-70 factor (ECF subfamily)
LKNLLDKDLIANYLKTKDEKFLEILIEKYLKGIYGFIYKNIGNSTDAQDVTQETFVKVWKNLKTFDASKNFKSWIFQIAKNSSIDFLRKRKTIPFSSFEYQVGNNALLNGLIEKTPSLCDSIDNKMQINSALNELSPKNRIVFNYKQNDNLTFNEIATSLGESINTVKSRYRRALKTMRNYLE